MYQVCRLVHADLSEYNILYNDRRLYIIDVSQSVEHDHPRSLEFLRMDIKNVGDFFARKGVDTLRERTVFNFVTAARAPWTSRTCPRPSSTSTRSGPAAADTDQAAADLEVDNEVFRNQYIPQTLQQVYDVEKEGIKLGAGLGSELPYRNLLADQVVLPQTRQGRRRREGRRRAWESRLRGRV